MLALPPEPGGHEPIFIVATPRSGTPETVRVVRGRSAPFMLSGSIYRGITNAYDAEIIILQWQHWAKAAKKRLDQMMTADAGKRAT